MANLEVIALDTVTPQLKAPQAGDGYAMPRPVAVTGTFDVTGAATATSLALGGATLGANALAVTGSSLLTGSLQLGGSDLILTRKAAASLQLGATDAAVAVAQTLNVQSVLAGTSNTAGKNFTINGSRGTGSGNGGNILFQVAPAGVAGTTQNALTSALAIGGSGGVTVYGSANNTALSLQGLTQTNSFPLIDGIQTWNNAATVFTGVKLNFTSSGSDATSLLMDLQLNDISQFNVGKNGTVAANGLNLIDNVSQLTFGFSSDLILTRKQAGKLQFGAADAAAPVAQTIGPQSVVAGTSNTAGQNFTVRGSQGTGTGAGGSILFQTAPAGGAGTAQNALVTQLTISSGAITSASGTDFVSNGNFQLPGTYQIRASSNLRIAFPSDGVVTLLNWASTDFGRLQLGGTTSSFPAIKRSTTIVQIRLADDSAYAPLEGSTLRTATAYTVATLPVAGSAGRRAYVTDALAPTFLGTMTGGGAVVTPVFDNGTAWVAG